MTSSQTEPVNVHVTAAFSELGLDSVDMVRLAAWLGATLGRPVSPLVVFASPTIIGLSKAVVEELGNEVAAR